jgi:hypothetical protein
MPDAAAAGPGWLFPATAASVIALHAILLFGSPGLHGGVDLLAHLRMVELMGSAVALRNVYPPAYHLLGALLSPLIGLAAYPKLFAVGATAVSIGCFRFFQRRAGLPDHVSILFALWPYSFSLSWSMPKVEVLGYALVFFGLGLLLARRHAGSRWSSRRASGCIRPAPSCSACVVGSSPSGDATLAGSPHSPSVRSEPCR